MRLAQLLSFLANSSALQRVSSHAHGQQPHPALPGGARAELLRTRHRASGSFNVNPDLRRVPSTNVHRGGRRTRPSETSAEAAGANTPASLCSRVTLEGGSDETGLRTAVDDLAVGVHNLLAAWVGVIVGSGRRGSRRPDSDGPAGGPSGDAGVAHRRRGASDSRLRLADERARWQGGSRTGPRRRPTMPRKHGRQLEACRDHFAPPGTTPAGISSMSLRSVIATPLAPAGGLKANASGAGLNPFSSP